MKKLIKSLVCFVLLFSLMCGTLSGCGAKLVDWNNQTIEVTYGSVYRLETIAFDVDGKEYAVTATVKTKNGETVFANGNKFTATDKGGYVITYKVDVKGNVQTKKVTVNVIPGEAVITYGKGLKAVYTTWPCDIPTVSAYDYYDGDVSQNITLKIFKKDANGDIDLNYDGNGQFTFTDAGEYYLRASVTNQANVTKVLDKPFTVTDATTLTNTIWKVTEETKDVLSSGMAFISADKLEGKIEGEYKGNAMTRLCYGSLANYINYSLGNRDLTGYTYVQCWVAVDKMTEETATDSFYFTFSRTTDNALFSKVLDKSTLTVNKETSGKWIKYLIPIAEFEAFARGKDQVQLIQTRGGGFITRPNLYIGDITLIADENSHVLDMVGTDKTWNNE
ncbi:MAG: hypothetical protein IJX03_01685 [Clostridia bacterium]|nr:hypothetical protein [Clostridia bacterium]